MIQGAVGTCVICKKDGTYVVPLHGDNGGPPCCPFCMGQWHAEHGRRRRLGRIVIRAIAAYLEGGGSVADLEKLKATAIGIDLFGEAGRLDSLAYMADAAKTGGETIELTTEVLDGAIRLAHPDQHPPERQELAQRVTQQLLALKPFVFPAPAPKPAPARATKSATGPAREAAGSAEKRYPCKECAATIPYYYCAVCRAEFEKRNAEEAERQREKQRRWRARRRQSRVRGCAACGVMVRGKRKDARFCSARCRQAAHRKAVTDKRSPARDFRVAVTGAHE
jgi:hypothetical protein